MNKILIIEDEKMTAQAVKEALELNGMSADIAEDGILVDMNVICGNGLVGIVTGVTDNTAIVRSIIDGSSNVTGMLVT